MSKDKGNDGDGESTIGYGKPPRSTQFRPGVSGNPRGRPKGSKNFATILMAVGRQKVKVSVQGKPRVMTRDEIAVMHLHNKADGGDMNAIKALLGAKRLFAESEEGEKTSTDTRERDEAVIRNFLNRTGLNAPNKEEI